MLALELATIAVITTTPCAWVVWWMTHDSTQYPDRPRRHDDS